MDGLFVDVVLLAELVEDFFGRCLGAGVGVCVVCLVHCCVSDVVSGVLLGLVCGQRGGWLRLCPCGLEGGE